MGKFTQYIVSLLMVTMLLIGCGGGGESSSSATGAGAIGTVAKGPFKQGSVVVAYKLNANGSRSTTSKHTSTTGDRGHFDFGASLSWTGTTEFVASGKYLNENTGAYINLPDSKGLSAIVDIERGVTKTVNINILTDMATKSIKASMTRGSKFSNAKQQAQSYVKNLFNLSNDIALEKLDLTDGLNNTQDNTRLLLVSSALLKTADPEQTLKDLEDDFADDGKIDSIKGLAVLNKLKNKATQVDIQTVVSTLENADIGVNNPPHEIITDEIINIPTHNQVPIANNRDYNVTKNAKYFNDISLSGSDPDGDALTYIIVSSPKHGTLSNIQSSPKPKVTYTPDTDYTGSDSFTFKVNDGFLDSAYATVNIQVLGSNQIPVAHSASYTFNANSTDNTITLTGSDGDGDSLTYSLLTPARHGTVSGRAPNLTYTPTAGYVGDDSFMFIANDGQADSMMAKVNITLTPHIYGEGGTHSVSRHDEVDANMTTAYCPADIPNGTKVPVIFFASGYNSIDSNDYKSLLTFIASQGYCVIYSKQNIHGWNDVYANLDKMLDNANGILPKLDTTRIGVIGHSLGGGYAFSILKHFSDMGYGANGRFVMVLEGYYAYNLTKQEMQNLPSNTNVVMQQYGAGGNNAINDTDPRITLTEFYMLDSIPKNQKDWQIVENADHHYPYGDKPYTQMQGILKPLDALMEYTFKGTALAHDAALEVGNDDPYAYGNGIQTVNPVDDYGYKCDHDIDVAIDYCDMAQWYSNKQLILHQKGHWLPMMAGNFASRAAYINTLPFSGFTMVGNSYTDRVMESNTTLLPYSYIWDEVKGVKDLYPTKSNFLTVNMHFPGDFWDDAVWDNVIANFGTLARVAKNLGYRGIAYDDEPYDVQSHKMINYKHGDAWYDNDAYKNPNYTFAEHSQKITARFKQIMEAMVDEYPAIDVLYYHSPVEGHIKADNGINGHPVVVDVGLEREHEWTGAMFTGLKKGLSHQAELHDMGEDYKLRTQAHFDDAYAWRKYTIASDITNDAVDDTEHWIVPPQERGTWAKEVNVDFMVSNEPLNSGYAEFNTTNKVGLSDIKTTLERALDKSDKYVIFYSASSSDNKGGRIPLDWLNDPATKADDGSAYSLDTDWKNMVEDVYTDKVLK